MKIVVTGGTGFVGERLVRRLSTEGYDVVILSRRTLTNGDSKIRSVRWDGKNPGPWTAELDGADAVINLAGESIGARRWSPAQKTLIRNSRLDATAAIIEAIRGARKKPTTLISASASGYYGHVESVEVSESYPGGSGFLAEVCRQWEAEAERATSSGVRVALTRFGVVLGRNGGALKKMMMPFRFFVGGSLGRGTQWFPWIHVDDLVGSLLFILSNVSISGPVNVVTPHPVTMKEFALELGRAMRRPAFFSVPEPILKIALGEMSDMLLTGQRMIPLKLQSARFRYLHPELPAALRSIITPT